MSRLFQITDLVAALINDAKDGFAVPIVDVIGKRRPQTQKKDLNDLVAFVTPHTRVFADEQQRLDSDDPTCTPNWDYVVEVTLARKLLTVDPEGIDRTTDDELAPLTLTVEQVADMLARSLIENAVPTEVEHVDDGLFDEEELSNHRMFISTIRVKYPL